MHVAIDAYVEGENFNLEVSLYFLAALFLIAKNVVGKGRQRKAVVNVSMHIMKNMLCRYFSLLTLQKQFTSSLMSSLFSRIFVF